jgi:glycosyltransferase involved in cell wall biosynthesis
MDLTPTSPRVSAVMIFLNGEAYIDEAIQSVCDQTFTDWELILVDDGSTDRSTDIAKAWVQRDPDRIRYIDHDGHANLGMSASRNAGIAAARGEYVTFLDCDDVLLPAKLEAQVAIMDADKTLDATYCAHRLWHSWSGDPRDLARDRVERIGIAPDTVAEPGDLLTLFRRHTGAVPAINAILARRESVLRVGGFADEFRGCYEDQVFYAKLGLHFRTFVSGACDVLYRQHPASNVAIAEANGEWHPWRRNAAERIYLEWLERYLEANGVDHGETWDLVQESLSGYRGRGSSGLSHRTRRRLGVVARTLLGATR